MSTFLSDHIELHGYHIAYNRHTVNGQFGTVWERCFQPQQVNVISKCSLRQQFPNGVMHVKKYCIYKRSIHLLVCSKVSRHHKSIQATIVNNSNYQSNGRKDAPLANTIVHYEFNGGWRSVKCPIGNQYMLSNICNILSVICVFFHLKASTEIIL